MKYLIVIVLFISVSYNSFCQNQDTTAYKLVDIEPKFEYKSAKSNQESVSLYVQENIKYPAILCDIDISGKVYIEFVVELDGHLSNFKVLRGIDEIIDNASIDVLKTMPKWTVAKKGNNNVRALTSVFIRW